MLQRGTEEMTERAPETQTARGRGKRREIRNQREGEQINAGTS